MPMEWTRLTKADGAKEESMRIAIAEISQETDSFTPIPTDLNDFQDSIYLTGRKILDREKGRDVLDGGISVFEPEGIEIVPLLWAKAVPKGKITSETYRFFLRTLTEMLQGALPVDGLYLSLHGALMAEDEEDVSGRLLEAARLVLGCDIPIVCPFDHHANLTGKIIANADMIVGFTEQPHNFFDTGQKAAKLLLRLLTEKLRPVTGWVKIPMITPQDRFLTSKGPMKSWFDLARDEEKREAILAVSQFPMQPWLDAAEGGWSVVVHGVGPSVGERLEETAAKLAAYAWDRREEFWISERLCPTEAVEQVEGMGPGEGPVILADTGDSVYGGAPGDSTVLIKAIAAAVSGKDSGKKIYLVPVVDAAAVETAAETGFTKTELTFGGRYDPFSDPVTLTGRITALSHGFTGLTFWGVTDIGRSVLFESGCLKIVLMEKRSYAINLPVLYYNLGIDPKTADAVTLKTGSNFQFFLPFCKKVVRVDTPGTTQSDLHNFSWERLPVPTYPIHPLEHWVPEVRIREE